MITSIPSQEKAWPGFVQAFARSMWTSAGRAAEADRGAGSRAAGRCRVSASKIAFSISWMSIVSSSLAGLVNVYSGYMMRRARRGCQCAAVPTATA